MTLKLIFYTYNYIFLNIVIYAYDAYVTGLNEPYLIDSKAFQACFNSA